MGNFTWGDHMNPVLKQLQLVFSHLKAPCGIHKDQRSLFGCGRFDQLLNNLPPVFGFAAVELVDRDFRATPSHLGAVTETDDVDVILLTVQAVELVDQSAADSSDSCDKDVCRIGFQATFAAW